jgi:hypothetical protein
VCDRKITCHFQICNRLCRDKECFDMPYLVEHNRDLFGKARVGKVGADMGVDL